MLPNKRHRSTHLSFSSSINTLTKGTVHSSRPRRFHPSVTPVWRISYDLKIKGDYFPNHHHPVALFNGDPVYFLSGGERVLNVIQINFNLQRFKQRNGFTFNSDIRQRRHNVTETLTTLWSSRCRSLAGRDKIRILVNSKIQHNFSPCYEFLSPLLQERNNYTNLAKNAIGRIVLHSHSWFS